MMDKMCDIVPGVGIGHFSVGMSEEEMLKNVDERYTIEDLGTSRRYHMSFMRIWVDKNTKCVEQITVGKGFEGMLCHRIGIGSKLHEQRSLGEVYCQYTLYPVYMIKGIDGICFEVEDDKTYDDEEDEEEKAIEWISLFH